MLIPIPCPIEQDMPEKRQYATLFLITKAKIGPGDLAHNKKTNANDTGI